MSVAADSTQFTPSGTILRLKVSDLRVTRAWNAGRVGAKTPPADLQLVVTGIATVLHGDRLQVMGSAAVPATTLTLECRGVLTRDDLEVRWGTMRAEYGALSYGLGIAPQLRDPRNDEESRLNALAHQKLSESPPSAILAFIARDPGLGNNDQWHCECTVLQDMLTLMGNDIIAGLATELNVWIHLMPVMLESKYGRGDYPRTIGFIRAESYGWLEHISWRVSVAGPPAEA